MIEEDLNQSSARPELLQIAESVAREKSIDQNIVIKAMEQAIQSAAKGKYGQELNIRAGINKKSGEIEIARVLEVVENVENSATEITFDFGYTSFKRSPTALLLYLENDLPLPSPPKGRASGSSTQFTTLPRSLSK